MPISENGRNIGTDAPPEGADPLLWELSQLRQVAQGALATAAKTRNLSATASLLRAANGLLDLLARIEKRVGSDGPTVLVAIATNPEWLSLQAKLLAVLDHHPAARADVLAALRGDVQAVPALPAHTAGFPGASGNTVEPKPKGEGR